MRKITSRTVESVFDSSVTHPFRGVMLSMLVTVFFVTTVTVISSDPLRTNKRQNSVVSLSKEELQNPPGRSQGGEGEVACGGLYGSWHESPTGKVCAGGEYGSWHESSN